MKRHPFAFMHYRVRRSACFECRGPASPLGEAVRLDLAEGGFTVIHTCLRCVRRRRAGHLKEALAA